MEGGLTNENLEVVKAKYETPAELEKAGARQVEGPPDPNGIFEGNSYWVKDGIEYTVYENVVVGSGPARS